MTQSRLLGALLLAGLLIGQVSGCGAGGPPANAISAPAAQAIPKSDSDTQTHANSTSRKIVFTAQVDVVVEDIGKAHHGLSTMIASVEQTGGYLSHQELQGATGSPRRGTWTIRVPQPQFDNFMTDVEQLGELQRSSRDAQDVTEAYTDLDARLRNMQASEQRLLGHLERTGDLKDTLEVERELSRVRGEVERLQGQLNVLKDKTTLATVIVTLQERLGYTPTSTPTFAIQVTRTFHGSLQALGTLSRFIALFVVGALPWICVAAPVLGLAWVWRRRVFLKRS